MLGQIAHRFVRNPNAASNTFYRTGNRYNKAFVFEIIIIGLFISLIFYLCIYETYIKIT